jgi:CheY-like chemotaxis protein
VQGIVKSCNGDIRIYSEPDQGTQVKIYLPVVECKTPVVHPASSEPLPGGTERILLVDDEEAIAKMEQKILERLGYRVTIRTASTEAHTAFQAEPEAFDLLVTDMTMPNMTGIQLANKIRAIKPNIPVVICTGFSDQISQEKYKGYGIHDFVNKPVLGREFAKAIRNALDGTKTQKKLKYQPF